MHAQDADMHEMEDKLTRVVRQVWRLAWLQSFGSEALG